MSFDMPIDNEPDQQEYEAWCKARDTVDEWIGQYEPAREIRDELIDFYQWAQNRAGAGTETPAAPRTYQRGNVVRVKSTGFKKVIYKETVDESGEFEFVCDQPHDDGDFSYICFHQHCRCCD